MTIEIKGFLNPDEIEDMFDSEHINIKHYDFDEDGYCHLKIRANDLQTLGLNLVNFYLDRIVAKHNKS